MNEKQLYAELGQNAAPEKQALCQIASACEKAFKISMVISEDGFDFSSKEKPPRELHTGVVTANGCVTAESIVHVRVELLRTSSGAPVNSARFFQHLAMLGEKVRVVAPIVERDGLTSLFVELNISAAPLSFTRQAALLKELQNLSELAKVLQAEIPRELDTQEIAKQYASFTDVLEPVYLFQDSASAGPAQEWAKECMEFLSGCSSLAISFLYPVEESFILSLLATVISDSGLTIAKLAAPMMPPKALLETVKRAPGIVVVPAVRLSLGTNAYELANEVQAMLSTLSSARIAVVFTGSEEQLRSVFHGGQGGIPDPLSPVVRRVPEVSIDTLSRFALQFAYRMTGGLPAATENELLRQIRIALQSYSISEQKRILPSLACRSIALWKKGKLDDGRKLISFASTVSSATETLAGLTVKPRATRTPSIAERYTQTFIDPNLGEYFKERLLGQDLAIDQLVFRLRMEALTRPAHQPIRYCAQGTPATGKSESAVLLASRLGVPYMNVDAASIPDYYSAAAQLLGSGRGIVGSYQSGRLEQAAKQHTGVVIEISDLDHANERVRSGLADLFLQVLETGEAQSAAGAMFSCANLIFAFTMNLPDGMDEAIRKRLGFNDTVTDHEVQSRVIGEIKKMLSTAFLSRIGTPILFQPLGIDAMGAILERAIRDAIQAAAERLQVPVGKIVLEENLGARIARSVESRIASFGARALLEEGRTLAAEAVADLQRSGLDAQGEYFVALNNQRLKIAGKMPAALNAGGDACAP